jgi:hypothetical protein
MGKREKSGQKEEMTPTRTTNKSLNSWVNEMNLERRR